MKKALLFLLIFISCRECFSQYNPKPSNRTRFYNSKFSTFPVKAGDILIYSVRTDSGQYDMIVTIKKFDKDINFDFIIPSKSYFGNIIIPATSVEKAVKYDTTFDVEKKVLKDESVLWLSKKSFSELYLARETEMDMGGGKETFRRGNTRILKINYKGKTKMVTMYDVQSSGENGSRTFSVLNDLRNPLMMRLNNNVSLVLKEVR